MLYRLVLRSCSMYTFRKALCLFNAVWVILTQLLGSLFIIFESINHSKISQMYKKSGVWNEVNYLFILHHDLVMTV